MRLKRALLSVAVFFQLCVVLVAPNKDTYHGQYLAPVLGPYMAFFEMGSAWNFFAPDPGPPPMFLEWEAFKEDGGMIENSRFPEMRNPYFFNDRQTRRVALTRFFFFDDGRFMGIWGDYICRKNPETYGVRLWKTLYTIPKLFDVQKGKRAFGDDVGAERKSVGTHFCNEAKKVGI